MPSRKEWKAIHANLMSKLHLPCQLRFSKTWKVGGHDWDDGLNGCFIAVNLDADFRVPEHLILHEAAHHRVLQPLVLDELAGNIRDYDCYHRRGAGHCKHWAETLCDLYKETETALPYSTGFQKFADVAGIKFKLFDPNVTNQMLAVEVNAHLLEGA